MKIALGCVSFISQACYDHIKYFHFPANLADLQLDSVCMLDQMQSFDSEPQTLLKPAGCVAG